MTFQQLQYLLEVYQAGSISHAAKKLFVAQSSVSNTISHLEEELGFPIFFRSRAGVVPTERGLAVLEHASRICESYRRMTEETPVQTSRLWVSAAEYIPINDAFVRFCMENQNRDTLSLSYLTLPLPTALEKLTFFELDMIATLYTEPGDLAVQKDLIRSKGLCIETLKVIPAQLRIGPNHPLYDKPDLRLEDMQGYTLVDASGRAAFNNQVVRSALDLTSERAVFIRNHELRYQLVSRGGMYYSIGGSLPRYVQKQYNLRCISLDDYFQYHLVTVYNPLRPKTPEMERFLALLDEELAGI
jgi:DNA-binding transcriptional LysR family regulator